MLSLLRLSYFTDLQGSQTGNVIKNKSIKLSYFTDLQGSQTSKHHFSIGLLLSYFTDLQGSQTIAQWQEQRRGLVTLLIYKVLKRAVVTTDLMNA